MEVSQAPGRVAGFREVGGQVARRRVGGACSAGPYCTLGSQKHCQPLRREIRLTSVSLKENFTKGLAATLFLLEEGCSSCD